MTYLVTTTYFPINLSLQQWMFYKYDGFYKTSIYSFQLV